MLNDPPHSEACFCFELELECEELRITPGPAVIEGWSQILLVESPALYHWAIPLYQPRDKSTGFFKPGVKSVVFDSCSYIVNSK